MQLDLKLFEKNLKRLWHNEYRYRVERFHGVKFPGERKEEDLDSPEDGFVVLRWQYVRKFGRVPLGTPCHYYDRCLLPKPRSGKIFIYGLCDDEQTGYVGATEHAEQRFAQHISTIYSAARKERKRPHEEWLVSLMAVGKTPTMKILEVCGRSESAQREKYWIEHCNALNIVRDGRHNATTQRFALQGITDAQLRIFKRAAKREGLSWSAWLLRVGEKAARENQ